MSGTGHMRENEEGIHAEFEVSEPIAGMRLDAALAGSLMFPAPEPPHGSEMGMCASLGLTSQLKSANLINCRWGNW